jgi:hypothetical protein
VAGASGHQYTSWFPITDVSQTRFFSHGRLPNEAKTNTPGHIRPACTLVIMLLNCHQRLTGSPWSKTRKRGKRKSLVEWLPPLPHPGSLSRDDDNDQELSTSITLRQPRGCHRRSQVASKGKSTEMLTRPGLTLAFHYTGSRSSISCP